MSNNGQARLVNVTFQNNQALTGGGLRTFHGATTTLSEVLFSGNISTTTGGGGVGAGGTLPRTS